MRRDSHVRFCEGGGVRAPSATRPFEVALFETIFHHGRFMARTNEPAGWTSQFREIVLSIDARLHDLRGGDPAFLPALDPDNYAQSQALGARLRALGSDGVAYPSLRYPGGECVGLSTPMGPGILSQVGASTIIGMARASICAGILGAAKSIASFETAPDIWAPRLTLAPCYSPSALHVGARRLAFEIHNPHPRTGQTARRPARGSAAVAAGARLRPGTEGMRREA